MKKRSYSPFKMIGPWISSLLLFLLWIAIGKGLSGIMGAGNSYLTQIKYALTGRTITGTYVFAVQFYTFIIIIVGFLLGWGIQSLIIKWRK